MSAPKHFLFADSQLLFRDEIVRRIVAALPRQGGGAAYLGASNGDDPEFFALFEAAMERTGIPMRKHVTAAPKAEELAFLDRAELVLLAGGDVARGWRAFVDAGIDARLRAAIARDAVLVGVSAGAVQLGTAAAFDPGVALLGLVPHAVDVHDEPEWAGLSAFVAKGGGKHVGLGIPLGGGIAVRPDRSVESLLKPSTELVWAGGSVRKRLLGGSSV
jgi:hypothetical protein